jgi:antitoxin (DNA-binding transcriptional repressor) of toxin-antitoxin stability system
MKTMNASEFKAKCLKELDNLPDEGIVLTKHGKPVAKVLPMIESKKGKYAKYIGCMKGQIKIHGNIFSTGRKWNAQS